MDDCLSFEQALDLAIGCEQTTADLYAKIAEQTGSPVTREIFNGFSREERAHKAKLEFIKSTGEIKPVAGQTIDFEKASDLACFQSSPDMDYLKALELAMKQEKLAFMLYSALASKAPNDALRTAFSTLAFEEANHRLRAEIAFDALIEELELKK
jgi:rubrerythrin